MAQMLKIGPALTLLILSSKLAGAQSDLDFQACFGNERDGPDLSAAAYYSRGNIYKSKGLQDRAESDFAKARTLDPSYAPATAK